MGTMDKLISEHICFINKIARKFYKTYKKNTIIDVRDIIGMGVIGLLDAKNRFDPTKNTPFSHYARSKIRFAILEGLNELFKTAEYKKQNIYMMRLDDVDKKEKCLIEKKDTKKEFYEKEINILIKKIINCFLDDKEKIILEMSFNQGKTNKEIGEKIGLKQRRVLQIKSEAIQKIRKNLYRVKELENK